MYKTLALTALVGAAAAKPWSYQIVEPTMIQNSDQTFTYY